MAYLHETGPNGMRRTPVRVMHLVYSLAPGGMEHGVLKLANALPADSVQTSICSTTPGGALKGLVDRRVPVFELQRRPGNDPKLVLALARVLRRERPHILHTHGWGTLLEGLMAARLARVPAVIHGEHGTLPSKPYQCWLLRRGWGAVDQVLAVSARLADRAARDTGFPRARIMVIENGVDLRRFGGPDRDRARRALGVASGARVVSTIGRLVPVKDHATLLDAIGRIAATSTDARLLVAGDGPLRMALEQRAAALGLTSVVRFLGHRSDPDVVLAASDVFALSSTSEGMSNTILEAMATGLPVVATDVGGARELVDDGTTGLLVPSGSPAELAGALGLLLHDDRLRGEMGAAGRVRVESSFSLDKMVRRYERLYTDIAARSRRPGVAVDTDSQCAGAA